MGERPIVPAIVGPTCSGKSGVALYVAERLDAEIISMESMQVYRGFDIGTAKVGSGEQERIPHHLIDICEADEPFTVADYEKRAKALIRGLLSKGKLPLLIGGTGLYLDAVRYRMTLGSKPGDDAYRKELHEIADAPEGKQKLHDLLKEKDPEAAARLHPNDVRRVIRALEVAGEGDAALPKEEREQERDFCVIPYGLSLPRDVLYKQIDKRVDEMIKLGLFLEWDRMNERVPFERWAGAAQAIGYKEIKGLRDDEYDKAEAVRLIKRNTRRYAKRQMTWFTREPGIRWFDGTDYGSREALGEAVLKAIRSDLAQPETAAGQ